MAQMVFQEEVRPETIKATACAICLFSGKLMFVLYFLLYTLSWREKRECCRVQICRLFFFFFLRSHHTCSFSLTFFSFKVIAIILCFFFPFTTFLVSILLRYHGCYLFYFFPNFSFSFLFTSFHSIKKKGLVRFPWNGGSVCMACESKLR